MLRTTQTESNLPVNYLSLREFARNKIPVLRRIFVRIQGATMGAYCNIRALSQRRIRIKRQARWGCLFL